MVVPDRISLSVMPMSQDESFIELMVLAAANWLSDQQLSLAQLRSEPDLLHYFAGWPRRRHGCVAVDGAKAPIGAVWLRQFPRRPGLRLRLRRRA